MFYHQVTITVAKRFRQPMLKKLAELGSLGSLEQERAVVSYFPSSVSAETLMKELQLTALLLKTAYEDAEIAVEMAQLPDADWNENWKNTFQPIEIGEHFIILPPWIAPPGERIPIIIDPGMAFGTGHHETTRSCLVLMERFVQNSVRDRFLDLGTGTGLLAIAALRLGFRSVVGVDTDPQAIRAALRNLVLNGAEKIELHEGTLEGESGGFSMIAANLISGTLIRNATGIASRLAVHGIAILSGILAGQEAEVEKAVGATGLQPIERLLDNKWITLAYRA